MIKCIVKRDGLLEMIFGNIELIKGEICYYSEIGNHKIELWIKNRKPITIQDWEFEELFKTD